MEKRSRQSDVLSDIEDINIALVVRAQMSLKKTLQRKIQSLIYCPIAV